MKIEFEGRTWQMDERDITNRQAAAIRAHTGLSVQKWFESLADTGAVAWEASFDALYWLMLQQNGEGGGAISDVDYPVYRFMEAYAEAFAAEHKPAEAEPDPTRPAADSAPSPGPSSRKAAAGTGGPPDG